MMKSSDAVRASLIWLALGVLICVTANADSLDRTIFELQHTAWTAREGAPSAVFALAQTADGYLWLGTDNGLFRFDGIQFERYEPPSGERLSSNNIASLMATADGGLWIGFRYGNASFLKDGRVITYSESEGLPAGSIVNFAVDREGVIWAAVTGGLARFDGTRWRRIGEDWAYPGKSAWDVFVDRSGTLWVSTEDTIVFLPQSKGLFQRTGERIGRVTQIAQAPNGQIWISDVAKGIIRSIRANQNASSQPYPGTEHQIGELFFGRAGDLWVSTPGNGILRVPSSKLLEVNANGKPSHRTEVFTERNGLTSDSPSRFLEDREGNIWVGSPYGLDRFRQSNLVPVLPLADNGPVLIAGEEGNAWVIGQKDRNNSFLIDTRNVTTSVHGTANGGIRCAYRDSTGTIWLGAFAPEFWKVARGRLVRIALPVGIGNAGIQAMTQDRSGGLWVSIVRNGVFLWRNGDWEHFGNLNELPKLTAVSLLTDSASRVWFGYMGSKIALLDGKSVRIFGPQDGLQVTNVMAMYERAGHVWVGGEHGLAIFRDNRFQSLTSADIAFDGISGIVETKAGDLWLNAAPGVVHISSEEVQHVLENPNWHLHVELLDFHDGLRGKAPQLAWIPSTIETPDGRLWFKTSGGLASIDPHQLSRNLLPPPVFVRSLDSNGKTYLPSANLRLPVGSSDIHIEYTALNFSVPERVRFRYKLEGADKDWADVGTRREAFYTKLGPGPYRFRVIACNNDGVWNEGGATLAFSIAPAWYQTNGFLALCVISVLFFVWALYRMRLRQVASAISAQFDERLAERTRLARELHDTFLQTVQGSKMVADDALDANSDETRMRKALEKLSAWLAQAVDEGRAALHSLRVSTVEKNHLSESLQRATEDPQIPASMTVTFSVIGDARDLHPVVRDDVYRVAFEAIRNAAVHSRASLLEIDLRYADTLSLRIKDNGIGIDPTISDQGKAGHFGLQGMRERAARIHSKLTIVSSANGGTEVALIVPGNVVFRTAHPTLLERFKAAVRRLLGVSSVDGR